ncbi:HXXXD-type acyl-transferase family protein [Striga asiatica]|uniref:HXXXD-type acyl-transferase family protein n=1 Tax=Striga asiatica TaxID=4170 RepID=A0A5A7PFW1_STRAF|nr:HXXXD-type acyl-transferase family protein [Striga asiatica]
MYVKRNFEVKVTKTEVVAAALPMQDHWLPLSNLDLLLPPVDVGIFFCYGGAAAAAGVLKKALAQALVSYYAFGGELVKNGAGEPELLCNNGGVDFSEARADVALEEIDFHRPDESVDGKLVPVRRRGVLAVQVTHLNRGGLVVACTFAHQVADAHSTNMFLISWAEMARSEPLSQPPSFRRSLLLPRRPGRYHLSVDHMYIPISALPPPPENKPLNDDAQSALSRIYYISSDRINELQSLANRSRTKLEAFCAFVWKTIVSGESSCSDDGFCRLGVVVDGRSRLAAPDIASYFGNVLSIPFGEKRIRDLRRKSLNWVADEVHAFLQAALSKEHFLGLIDWVEEHRPEPGLSRIYAAPATAEEPAVVVSSGQHFPVSKVDFGWGPPAFGSYHFPWGGKSGYVMPMPGPKGNGDWIVYMHLLKEQLDLIETNAGHVFVPLSSDYIFSC